MELSFQLNKNMYSLLVFKEGIEVVYCISLLHFLFKTPHFACCKLGWFPFLNKYLRHRHRVRLKTANLKEQYCMIYTQIYQKRDNVFLCLNEFATLFASFHSSNQLYVTLY